MSDPIRIIVLGAGQRGDAYISYLQSDLASNAKVVAIAEPDRARAFSFAQKHDVPQSCLFSHYHEIASLGPDAFGEDAVIVTTQDTMHFDCVVKFASLGYHILSEKPLATTLADCHTIVDTLKASPYGPKVFGIGHVLRYTPHNMKLRELLTNKVIGDVISISHTEPVGHAHFAHSYVRGSWRKEEDSAFSLLTKSCHDIDLIQWLLEPSYTNQANDEMSKTQTFQGTACEPSFVTSIGSLSHFRKSQKPKAAGEAKRCLDCNLVETCPYSAKTIYLDNFQREGSLKGFRKTLTDVEDVGSIVAALKSTKYGCCVYEMDNNVCDNQVVSLQYHAPHGHISVMFTMIAFSRDQCVRKTTIYGSKGQIDANGHDHINVYDFTSGLHKDHEIQEPSVGEQSSPSHASGDKGLVLQFVAAVRAVRSGVMNVSDAQSHFIGCTIDDMLRSHQIVFKAEEARLQRTVIGISPSLQRA